jgi:hypothetical protein
MPTILGRPRGDATLRGNYHSMRGGSVGGVVAVAFVGKIALDGKGKLTNPFTMSFAGAISEQVTQGIEAVNRDCTGTQTLGGTNHFNFNVSPDGARSTTFKPMQVRSSAEAPLA